jgi:hypothetical protein
MMKHKIKVIAFLVVLASCNKREPERANIYVVSGKDTIIITANKFYNIDVTKCHSSKGGGDTIEFLKPVVSYHYKDDTFINSGGSQNVNTGGGEQIINNK